MRAITWKQRVNYKGRPPLDRKAVRYFIYRLHDSEGHILYVGRSCNVAARIKAHIDEAVRGYDTNGLKARWVPHVRRVSMIGPLTWNEACRVERAEIEAHQPTGNRMFTKRYGWRPRTLRDTA